MEIYEKSETLQRGFENDLEKYREWVMKKEDAVTDTLVDTFRFYAGAMKRIPGSNATRNVVWN